MGKRQQWTDVVVSTGTQEDRVKTNTGKDACATALWTPRSELAIAAAFWVQHWFTAARHHSALRREALIGLPSTMAKIGLVCDDWTIRRAIQLLFSIETS